MRKRAIILIPVVLVLSIFLIGFRSGSYFLGKNDFLSLKESPGKSIRITGEPADSLSIITGTALPDSLKSEDTLLVAWKSRYRMCLFHEGKIIKTYIIGLGQNPLGHKLQQGDNRTPEGDYRIIEKSTGPFDGDYAAWFGVAWMRLNYPNNADAISGFDRKLITKEEKNSIINANNAGKRPPKFTKLGGGIGIHGWNGSWPENDRQNLTWGCITVQNGELNDLYARINLGTRIVIYP